MTTEIRPAGANLGFNDAAAWSAAQPLAVGATDDDAEPTDTRYVAYDRGKNYLYVLDRDGTGSLDDIYVFNLATGALVYSELNALDPGFVDRGAIALMTRGDINDDGAVTAADIDRLFHAIADPTLGGTVAAALGSEWYDLTGDGALSVADADELVLKILGTQYGDQDLDGDVDPIDLATIRAGFGAAAGWASGDNDGDGDADGNDFLRWQRNVGFVSPQASAVPEPAAALIAMLAAAATIPALRRRVSGVPCRATR